VPSEDISTPGGVFWEAGGVWHRSKTTMQENAKDTADSLKELRDCRHVADEAVNGANASKYSLHNQASGGDESVWIGKANGLVLKSEARFEDRQISSRYEFSNIQAPANVR
jgi:transcriptional regulator of acetoin/glycerol metabolism